MFRRYALKPDRGITRPDLAMDELTFRVHSHVRLTDLRFSRAGRRT
jgi:hypothetical protein